MSKYKPPTLTDKAPTVTILSIDGGGVRGIIPAVILEELENELQALEDKFQGPGKKKVRIADFFDMIVGTSAGSIVTALLTTPHTESDSHPHRPFTASKIVSLFKERSDQVFHPQEDPNEGKALGKRSKSMVERRKAVEESVSRIDRMINYVNYVFWYWTNQYKIYWNLFKKYIYYPKFDKSYVKKFTDDLLGNITLDQTLKPVVIPAYRIGNFGPYVFSTQQAKQLKGKLKEDDHSEDIRLADVVLSSTAAPVYFIPHTFNMKNTPCSFADGGMAAVNNPTMLGLGEATSQHGSDYSKYLVLSLGTGSVKIPEEPVMEAGLIYWFLPFVTGTQLTLPRALEILFNSTTAMADIYMTSIFKKFPKNYLRIQESELAYDLSSLSNVTPENLEGLVQVGKDLINKKRVTVTDTQTGQIKQTEDGPLIKDALKNFAYTLYLEKKRCNKPDAEVTEKMQQARQTACEKLAI